jgi:multidrug efflux pump subunit AcrA (membrane-fusion protein)
LFKGSVERVAEVANQQGYFSSGVKEFEVRVTLDSFAGLRPGFSCRAEIITDTVADVVHVPIQAVFREGEGFVVYDTRGAARKVGVGISSITRVQVIDGIKAGDELLLTRPDGKASKKP